MIKRALVGCEESGEVRHALAETGYWDEVWSADFLPSERPVDWTVMPGASAVVLGTGTPSGREFHYMGDVLDLFDWNHPVNTSHLLDELREDASNTWPLWGFGMFHPPCDHLSQAGAVWWKSKDATRGGNGLMQAGAEFFMKMTKAPARYAAVENPYGVMCRVPKPGDPDRQVGYRRPDQIVSPWMFGDALVKRTCLWTFGGLPLLRATHKLEDYPEVQRVATGGGSHRTDWARTGRSNNGYEDSRGREFRKIMRSKTPPHFAAAIAGQWTDFIREQENHR